PEKLRADVDLVNIELRQGIMDEAIAIQPGAETAGDACGVKAEFEMFLFALLGLSQRFFDPAAWYELEEGAALRCFLTCWRSWAAASGVVFPASGWRLIPSSSQRWNNFTSISN